MDLAAKISPGKWAPPEELTWNAWSRDFKARVYITKIIAEAILLHYILVTFVTVYVLLIISLVNR